MYFQKLLDSVFILLLLFVENKGSKINNIIEHYYLYSFEINRLIIYKLLIKRRLGILDSTILMVYSNDSQFTVHINIKYI